jgi:beta-barrel assembly-enhancing protease
MQRQPAAAAQSLAAAGRVAPAATSTWARERLRVLSADSPSAALREYRLIRESTGHLEPAQRYGLAVAQMRDNATATAIETLAELLAERHPGDAWIDLTLAEAEARAGRHDAADRRFESLRARMPRDRAVALTYAAALAERNDPGAGRRAQDVLRPLHAAAAAIRVSSAPSPAPARSPATRYAPARPGPRSPSSPAGRNRRCSSWKP